jgi:hypothetical protein
MGQTSPGMDGKILTGSDRALPQRHLAFRIRTDLLLL